MNLSPLAGIQIQVSHDYPVFKFVLKKTKRKWGPEHQRVKVVSHYANALNDGEIIQHKQQNIFLMNPRTKHELDKAIAVENCKTWRGLY